MSIIPEQFADILESSALASMATVGPKGEPQVSTVLFAWNGTQLIFSMHRSRQKHRNLSRDPRIAVNISDPANPYRSLEIRGVARIESDPEFHYLHMLSRKYLSRDATPEEAGEPGDRVVIFVKPEKVISFPPVAPRE